MSYPDTRIAAATRILDRIRRGGDVMAEEALEVGEDAERRRFRLAAEQGARAYASLLETQIVDNSVTDLTLQMAELVARATECAGWLSTTTVQGDGREEAMRRLIAAGFFARYEAVPGEWVACYRLVAP
jgi:hypothetical protein